MHYRCILVWDVHPCVPFKNKKINSINKMPDDDEARSGQTKECLAPNISILQGLWNEDTRWSDGGEGGTRGPFRNLRFLRGPEWRWC